MTNLKNIHICEITDAEREMVLQDNLANKEQNLQMLKNIFETESNEFLLFAIDYLQEGLENMILHLSDPDKLENLKQIFSFEQASGSLNRSEPTN